MFLRLLRNGHPRAALRWWLWKHRTRRHVLRHVVTPVTQPGPRRGDSSVSARLLRSLGLWRPPD